MVHIAPRLLHIYRTLTPYGTLFLHCDPSASHYLKLLLDTIFITQNGIFLNEIIWYYQTGGNTKKRFARKHDIIFWYAKTKNKYRFFPENILTPRTPEVLRRLATGNPTATRAQNTHKLPDDVFQIQALNAMANERKGYPTQKPEALLCRLLKATTTPQSTVLDAYCGSGTTLAVAHQLGCQFVGIDKGSIAIQQTQKRLQELQPIPPIFETIEVG